MRTRIWTAAVALVIGASAATLAQRQEQPQAPKTEAPLPRIAPSQEPQPKVIGVPSLPLADPSPVLTSVPKDPSPVPAPVLPSIEEADPVIFPADPSPVPAIPPQVPSPADPNDVASTFVAKAKAEIARLMGEKQEAEKELDRVKARIRAAEIGLAKWHTLANAMTKAMSNNEESPDDPAGTIELVPHHGEPPPPAKPAEPTLAPGPLS